MKYHEVCLRIEYSVLTRNFEARNDDVVIGKFETQTLQDVAFGFLVLCGVQSIRNASCHIASLMSSAPPAGKPDRQPLQDCQKSGLVAGRFSEAHVVNIIIQKFLQ